MYKIGKNIENFVSTYLQKQGLKLVEVNYRCRVGEIDLIMKDHDTLVFVEVRYRKKSNYGDGVATVDFRKQDKIKKAASCYLQKNNLYDKVPCRFDVVAVKEQGSDPKKREGFIKKEINWIKDAFWDRW